MTLVAPFAAEPVEPCMNTQTSTATLRRAQGERVRDYHQRTKHHLDRYAAGPGTLDWDAQPDPFRYWTDAQTLALPRDLPRPSIAWSTLSAASLAARHREARSDAAIQGTGLLRDARNDGELDIPSAPLDIASLSTLLRLSVSITAWKEYAGARWALRANPSSGNLHPTETWVIASGVQGVTNGLHHYQSRTHVLERRAWNDAPTAPGLWLGFSSIHWREAWKYGERAFRYCQLDLGHALAAVSTAAALLGWRVQMLRLDSSEVAARLGLDRAADFAGVEAEEPEVIVALDASASLPAGWLHSPQGGGHDCKAAEAATFMHYAGKPSLLDPHPLYQWPVIEEVAAATRGVPPPPDPSFRRKPMEWTPPSHDGIECARVEDVYNHSNGRGHPR
jgi:SagB-type dehydrogenase family enzyme